MRQERARETRAAVLLAGARVFEREGYAAASIGQILDEAGVTKGALYFHFDSKQSLADAVIAGQSGWHELRSPGQRPLQDLIDLSHQFADAVRDDPLMRASVRLTIERQTFATTDPAPYREWFAVISSVLARSEAEGELLDGIDIEELAQLVNAVVTGTQLVSEALSGRRDITARLTTLWRVLLPGIAAPDVLSTLRPEGRFGRGD